MPPIASVLSVDDLPLGEEIGFDNDESARIMRQIGVAEGELGTPVSAFNSSI
jgi:hypothetical protein